MLYIGQPGPPAGQVLFASHLPRDKFCQKYLSDPVSSLLSNDLLIIIHDYVGWSLTADRKQKNMCNFWPKKWSRSLKKFEWWLLTRELLR